MNIEELSTRINFQHDTSSKAWLREPSHTVYFALALVCIALALIAATWL